VRRSIRGRRRGGRVRRLRDGRSGSIGGRSRLSVGDRDRVDAGIC
jgi:hypothetical protein